MLLGASGEIAGQTIDVGAVRDDSKAATSGVPHAEALLAFTDAAMRGDAATLRSARDRVARELGEAALVDAAAIIGNFERMTRTADATGIPLDDVVAAMGSGLRETLGLGAFASAGNTPQPGILAKLARPILRPVFVHVMPRLLDRLAARRGS